MNKLLWRQLKRCFGLAHADAANLFDPRFRQFIERVSDSYDQYDRDIELRTRSLEISSDELQDANERLQAEIAGRELALDRLRRSAADLLAGAGLGGPAPADLGSLETLSRLITDLVAERLRVEAELRAGERRFRDLTEMSSDWFWEQDEELRFTTMSGGLAMSALNPAATIGKTRWELPILGVSEEDWQRHREILARRQPFDDFVYQIETAPDTLRWFSISGTPIIDDHGRFRGYRGIGSDITEQKRAEDDLRLAASVFETTAEAVMVTAPDARILAVNPAFEAITGYGRAEVVGKTPAMLSSGMHDSDFYRGLWHTLAVQGHWHGEIWDRRKSGEIYAIASSITAVKDAQGQVCKYVGVFSDVSERKRAEERISFLASHDFLTGLPNRVVMEDRLGQAIHLAERGGKMVALLFVDLDNFKNINDSLGHHVGDLILRTVAARLSGCVRKTDTVCRLGGDEFLVILSNLVESEQAARIAAKILAGLAEPSLVEGRQLYVTASIGIGVYPQDGADPVTLMKHADAAMYHSKRLGRNVFQFFTRDLNARVSERLAMENSLRDALDGGQFLLHYQPQVDIHTGRVVGLEALARWRHPEWGMVPPGRFIPVAEESGLIVSLGDWILREACRQMGEWRRNGWPVPVAVNISALQFHHKDFMDSVVAALEKSGLEPAGLELELTEGTVMRHCDESDLLLHRVKALGISLAVDDFGTGYSSLSYLKRFPIDRLKIDQSFVRDLVTDIADAEIIRAVTAVGHALGLRVIAEGVETPVQRDKLRLLGVDECQGYLFQRPLPPEALEPYLERHCDRHQLAALAGANRNSASGSCAW